MIITIDCRNRANTREKRQILQRKMWVWGRAETGSDTLPRMDPRNQVLEQGRDDSLESESPKRELEVNSTSETRHPEKDLV